MTTTTRKTGRDAGTSRPASPERRRTDGPAAEQIVPRCCLCGKGGDLILVDRINSHVLFEARWVCRAPAVGCAESFFGGVEPVDVLIRRRQLADELPGMVTG